MVNTKAATFKRSCKKSALVLIAMLKLGSNASFMRVFKRPYAKQMRESVYVSVIRGPCSQ